ncbi:MAG: 30S ribosomal protein S20 [Burkholderiales bacterium]|jgi:small subunit ribosomal protein S20|nr:30S ribosomal protein S20 [Burkholderiales bacterium]
MANTVQARKRARQAEVRRQQNAGLRSQMRTAIKNIRKAIQAGDKAAATSAFSANQSTIDAITGKGVVHRNLASRTKSRLAAAIKAMA